MEKELKFTSVIQIKDFLENQATYRFFGAKIQYTKSTAG
jgi:hypothetical protein